MPAVRVKAQGQASVGKLLPADIVHGRMPYEIPVQLKRASASAGIAVGVGQLKSTDKTGSERTGTPAVVKAGLHWLLVPVQGGYELHPADNWYEFAKPTQSSSSRAVPDVNQSLGQGKRKAVDDMEQELRKDSKSRKDLADKWEHMLKKRDERSGKEKGKAKVQDGHVYVMATNDDAYRESGGPAASKSKVPLDEDRLGDVTGIKKQTQKKRKALHKEAKAVFAEDEAVPDSANALLKLKHERGEHGWDFEDDDLFSDDEQEKPGFDDAEADDVGVPSGDEDAEKGDEDEKGDLLGSHGKNVAVLLQQLDENTGVGLSTGDGDEGADEMEVDEEPANVMEASQPPQVQSDQRQMPAKPAPKVSTHVSHDIASLRECLVKHLRESGGKSTMKSVQAAVGLKEKDSLFNVLVKVIKQVATIEKVKGETRPMICLKKELPS